MACPSNFLKAPVPTFCTVIYSPNLIKSYMKHVPQWLCKKRCPSRCVSTKPTYLDILKIINDKIAIVIMKVWSIITVLFKINFDFIRWRKCQYRSHSKRIDRFRIIDVSLLTFTPLNSFPQIRAEMKEIVHFCSFKSSSSGINSSYFKVCRNILA